MAATAFAPVARVSPADLDVADPLPWRAAGLIAGLAAVLALCAALGCVPC